MSVSQKDLNEGRLNDDLGTKLESLSAQVEANVERGRNALAEWKATLCEKGSQAAEKMDHYTHEHPWRMISSALLAGVLLGMLCGNQSSRRIHRY